MRSFIACGLHRLFSSPGFSNRGMAPMKSIIRGLPELTVRKLACLSLGLALAGCAPFEQAQRRIPVQQDMDAEKFAHSIRTV
jgi:hypothetical protein